MGLHSLPSMFRIPIGLYFLGLNLFPYHAQSNPDGWSAAWQGRRPWIHPMPSENFQTYDGGLNIHPRRSRWAQNAHEALTLIPSCNYIVAAYGGLETDELQIRSPTPCPRFHSLPDKQRLSTAGWVLLAPSPTRQVLSQLLLTQGFSQSAQFIDAQSQYIWVYQRPKSWFSNR